MSIVDPEDAAVIFLCFRTRRMQFYYDIS